MNDLPADSRITSRADGSTLIIRIPFRRQHRWASWGGVASFAFLAVVCLAQGVLRRQLGWVAAGLGFVIVAAWQWALLARRGSAVIEISRNWLSIRQAGTGVGQSRWNRADVSEVRADAGALRIGGGGSSVEILNGQDADELRWLAEQIRRQWSLQSPQSVQGNGAS
jgi:hypothetical protein